MNREHHQWYSHRLGREMEMLVFGHAGMPYIVFPTSRGRYFEFEDRRMVGQVADRIEGGHLRLYCVDSIDGESWYNRRIHPRHRVERHKQYEEYLEHEVVPLVRLRGNGRLGVTGCSFGGYQALNFALRRPGIVTNCVTMGAAFDIKQFLDGYYDEECYFHNPPDYLRNQWDPWYLERYRRNWFLMATGEHDFCWTENERIAAIMREKGVNHRLDVWGDRTGHDWPWWERMARAYLI